MNGVIIINKPQDWTSHDVVGRLRGIFRERRIGHGGTLDPMATGVLPVFVGRATRAVEFCENYEKEYVAGIKFGITTDTQDITGSILSSNDKKISREELESVLPEFKGELEQIPPMYSAVKIGGKKLYELARKGVEVERKPRKITIKEIEIAGESDGDFLIRFVCSKGTYIRTLCNDIGERLGCGAVMSSLVRVRAGAFTLDGAVSIEKVSNAAENGGCEHLLMPVDGLFSAYDRADIDEKQEKRCRNGGDFEINVGHDGLYRVYGADGSFLMLGKAENGIMKTVKNFFEVN